MKNKLKITLTSFLLGFLIIFAFCVQVVYTGLKDISASAASVGNVTNQTQNGNVFIFDCGDNQVKVELCTSRTVRVQLSQNGANGYRPANPEYYMVADNSFPAVKRTVSEENGYLSIKTSEMELRVKKNPFRIGMYTLEGELLSKDTDSAGMYANGNSVGVRKEENTKNAGGIFGFGSGDHGRRSDLNRYGSDFNEFTMSHGRLIAPFFMSTVGYGIFLNTIEKNTVFYKNGGGFQTEGYLDYFFMYGPDFKTILNEYAEITGRMELYGKWAHGFMLSKYGNDNATQKEFSEWINRLRDEGYPCDSYVFDYGWRGDVADNGGNQSGAGEKWGKQMWSNDITKFPDIAAMFEEADALGFKVGLHNNAGTPEAMGGKNLHIDDTAWVQSYMDSVITTGYGDWFWPDEFDVLGSNTAPVFSSKGAYEAWQQYADASRPMFITRGSYAGQHYATAWSGDINNTSEELLYQIGYSLDAGLVGYWAVSHDLGGFMKAPTDELYTRWVSEFGAWNGIMRAHGHDGREPWLYSKTSQDTLKKNLRIRYSLYPYIYTSAWQGYSYGTPIMRAMILEDGSQYNSAAYNLNQQYYFGDWFLVAPAADTADTVVSVWLPPETVWYDYSSGERYEGGANGKTIRVAAPLEEIPVFVKAGAIIPMGPDMDYADEKPLDPLTLDIYPRGTTKYALFEDDGESRKYITQNAYSTTEFTCIENGTDITFEIAERYNGNASVYQPSDRSYNLKFNNISNVRGVNLGSSALLKNGTLDAYNECSQGYWYDSDNKILYVKVVDDGTAKEISVISDGVEQPALGNEDAGLPPQRINSGDAFELEKATLTEENGAVSVKNENSGYNGSGYLNFGVNSSVDFIVNVVRGGTYDIKLRINCGRNSLSDSKDRTAALYLEGKKVKSITIKVTETWGIWTEYTVTGVELDAGLNSFKIASEGTIANFNIDNVKFDREDTSVDAFAPISAEHASMLTNLDLTEQDGKQTVHAVTDGAWVRFAEINGDNKGGLTLDVKSSTGGSIIVYENGVGDKILTTVELPADGKWHTLEVNSKNTDVDESDVYFEFKAPKSGKLDVYLAQFNFIRKIDAYTAVAGINADERNGINIRDGKLVNIENGDWAKFNDINFGDKGAKLFFVTAASGTTGGRLEVYIDGIASANQISEAEITGTGSWSVKKTFSAECENVTGVHDVYLKFVTNSGKSICDFTEFYFSADEKTVSVRVDGAPVDVQISNEMAKPGETVAFQIAKSYNLKEVKVLDCNGKEVAVTEQAGGGRWSFVLPENTPVTIVIAELLPQIAADGRLELEDGEGATNEAGSALRVDKEWSGYTGSGYVAGFKNSGNWVSVRAEVAESGFYTVSIRGGAGKKNESQYDSSPRSGALYIDGVKAGVFGLEIQSGWDVWITAELSNVRISAGIHTFKIVAEGSNAGNFNLDNISFVRTASTHKLEAGIAEAEKIDIAAYTQESISVLEAALANAKSVISLGNSSQSDIDAAESALAKALQGLAPIKTADTENGGGLSGGAIAGIAVGSVAGAALIGAGAFIAVKKFKKRK